jgi:hypothetical protein
VSVSDSGNATANAGGIANTGNMGPVQVEHHHHYPGLPQPSWPVRVGQVPALASAFQARPGLRDQIEAAGRLPEE